MEEIRTLPDVTLATQNQAAVDVIWLSADRGEDLLFYEPVVSPLILVLIFYMGSWVVVCDPAYVLVLQLMLTFPGNRGHKADKLFIPMA